MNLYDITGAYNVAPNNFNTPIREQEQLFKKKQSTHYTPFKRVIEGFGSSSSSSASSSSGPQISGKTESQLNSLLELEKLKATYEGLMQQYNATISGLSDKTDMYISATESSSSSEYSGKNVLLTKDGVGIAYGYVTSTGIFKWYGSWDIVDATSGKNGCPLLKEGDTSTYVTLETMFANKYNVSGTVLSRDPRIVVGSTMVSGQSCGNEKKNIYVSGTTSTEITYQGCYKDTSKHLMTKQSKGDAIYDYDSCKQAAMEQNSQYFALQGYDESTDLASCYIGTDYDKAISKGDADVWTFVTLWSSGDSGVENGYATFKNDGNIYIYDSKGKLKANTGTGTIECAPVVPTEIESTWGGNIDGIEDGNNTEYLQAYNTGTQSFTYSVGKGQSDPAKGQKKAFDASYKCGDKIKTMHINEEASKQKALFDCTDAGDPCLCYIILKNKGVAEIRQFKSGATAPSKKDKLVYAWPVYDVSDSVKNPTYPQDNSITGVNWIPGQTTLYGLSASNDYVVSDDGKLILYVGDDGNVYLGTFTLTEGCPTQKISGKKYAYGNSGNNALYGFASPPNNDAVGKVGYVDEKGELRVYKDDTVGYAKTYQKYANYTSGTTIKTYEKSDEFACKIACNTDDTCAGYVIETDSTTQDQTCYTKDKTVYPASEKTHKKGSDLYIRDPVINNSNSCSKQVVNVDSDMWDGYPMGDKMSADDTCDLRKVLDDPYKKKDDIQKQIDDVVVQMKNKFSDLQSQNVQLSSDMIDLQQKIGVDLQQYDQTNKMIRQKEMAQTTMNSMLSDSHLTVLQQNYKYTFFSIFAVGAVLIAMNVGKSSA